jgi:hypothetical protein
MPTVNDKYRAAIQLLELGVNDALKNEQITRERVTIMEAALEVLKSEVERLKESHGNDH